MNHSRRKIELFQHKPASLHRRYSKGKPLYIDVVKELELLNNVSFSQASVFVSESCSETAVGEQLPFPLRIYYRY
jgi:hypothetical protein